MKRIGKTMPPTGFPLSIHSVASSPSPFARMGRGLGGGADPIQRIIFAFTLPLRESGTLLAAQDGAQQGAAQALPAFAKRRRDLRRGGCPAFQHIELRDLFDGRSLTG